MTETVHQFTRVRVSLNSKGEKWVTFEADTAETPEEGEKAARLADALDYRARTFHDRTQNAPK